ncbi:MAG: hypothetical protein JXO50_11640 [Deltaproteobacteria bacterium]|nr:hypothetical protein [Candidatus Anaeroferrophillus wilburensis]
MFIGMMSRSKIHRSIEGQFLFLNVFLLLVHQHFIFSIALQPPSLGLTFSEQPIPAGYLAPLSCYPFTALGLHGNPQNTQGIRPVKIFSCLVFTKTLILQDVLLNEYQYAGNLEPLQCQPIFAAFCPLLHTHLENMVLSRTGLYAIKIIPHAGN